MREMEQLECVSGRVEHIVYKNDDGTFAVLELDDSSAISSSSIVNLAGNGAVFDISCGCINQQMINDLQGVAGEEPVEVPRRAVEVPDDEPGDVVEDVMEAGDDASAIEASLIENIARLDPDEVNRCEAFTRLVREGRSVKLSSTVKCANKLKD